MTDEIAITDKEMFRPRYDGIAKDSDRLMELVVDLNQRGRLRQESGKSLYDQYIAAAGKRLIAAYFTRELFAEIERYYTYAGEIAFGPPHQEMQDDLEKLIALGQGNRAIRVWRNYLALMKVHYWSLISARRRGFEKAPYLEESEASQRADWERWTGRVPAYKSAILAMMDDAKACFLRAGATQAQFSRLAIERAEVDAEKRRRPGGQPDKRKMDETRFWEIIGTPGDGGVGERLDALPDRLARFSGPAIKEFDRLLHEVDASAYRNDIWGLAYLLNDGCSDDDFAGFRSWLLLQGQEVFNQALEDPNSFDVALTGDDFGSGLPLWEVPLIAYEMRQGKPMRHKRFKMPDLVGADLEENGFARALPSVAAALGRER